MSHECHQSTIDFDPTSVKAPYLHLHPPLPASESVLTLWSLVVICALITMEKFPLELEFQAGNRLVPARTMHDIYQYTKCMVCTGTRFTYTIRCQEVWYGTVRYCTVRRDFDRFFPFFFPNTTAPYDLRLHHSTLHSVAPYRTKVKNTNPHRTARAVGLCEIEKAHHGSVVQYTAQSCFSVWSSVTTVFHGSEGF